MHLRATLLVTAILASTLPTLAQPAPNTLSRQEAAQGWHLLFDGKTNQGWHSTHGPDFPATGWEVKDGLLSVTEHGGEEGGNAGDILTTRKYTNFELLVDFRITPGANSGIKYFVDTNYAPGHDEHWLTGVKVLEYDRATPQFRQAVAESKFHVYPHFGEASDGYILLQDHGFPVSFRNIKIRELPPNPSQ